MDSQEGEVGQARTITDEVDQDHHDPSSTESILNSLSSFRTHRPPRDNFDADESDFAFFDDGRNMNPVIEEPSVNVTQETQHVTESVGVQSPQQFRGSQVTETNRGAQGSKLSAGHRHFSAEDAMPVLPNRGAQGSTLSAGHEHFSAEDAMPVPPDQYQHHRSLPIRYQVIPTSGGKGALVIYEAHNRRNQPIGGMVGITSFHQVTEQQYNAPLLPQLNPILHAFEISVQNSNPQHFGFPQSRPEPNLNPQTQSQVSNAGPSYYRGRGARGRGRRSRGRRGGRPGPGEPRADQ